MMGKSTNLAGRTYSLPEEGEYFSYISEQVDILTKIAGNTKALDNVLTELISQKKSVRGKYRELEDVISAISTRLGEVYTPQLKGFLLACPGKIFREEIMKISEKGYHLRMLHIETLNRKMQPTFRKAKHKIVILPHCLRDFRPDVCKFLPGEIDYVCGGCTADCLINETRKHLSDRPDCQLVISQTQDLEAVFERARQKFKSIGLIGVACIPELYEGVKLSQSMNIPAQGVPLNYNRCSRWLGEAQYTNFNIEQLKRIIEPIS